MVRVGHAFTVRMKTGARRDGTLVAREVEATLDGGAFADDSPGVLAFCLRCRAGRIAIRGRKAMGVVAYTNKLRSGAFRGFGQSADAFGGEQQIDEIARAAWARSASRCAARTRSCRASAGSAAGGRLEWPCRMSRRGREPRAAGSIAPRCPSRLGKRRGLGLACSAHISALLRDRGHRAHAGRRFRSCSIPAPPTSARAPIRSSRRSVPKCCKSILRTSSWLRRIRTAHRTTGAQPQAASPIRLAAPSSALPGRWSRQAKLHASHLLECAVDDIELRPGGRMGVKGAQGLETTFRSIAARAHWGAGGPIIGSHSWLFEQVTVDPKRAIAVGNAARSGVFSFSAMIVDVEVDEASGKIDVQRTWSAVDVGRAINPVCVEGQIEGAFVQGMGFALTEEVVWDSGRVEQSIADGLQGSRPARTPRLRLRRLSSRRRSPTVRSVPKGRARSE